MVKHVFGPSEDKMIHCTLLTLHQNHHQTIELTHIQNPSPFSSSFKWFRKTDKTNLFKSVNGFFIGFFTLRLKRDESLIRGKQCPVKPTNSSLNVLTLSTHCSFATPPSLFLFPPYCNTLQAPSIDFMDEHTKFECLPIDVCRRLDRAQLISNADDRLN